MKISLQRYWQPFKVLLINDIRVFKQVIAGKVFNMLIWLLSNIAINTYIMPFFGITSKYGEFMVAGTFASIGLFEVFPSAVNLVSDIQHDKIISYHLTLPLPSNLVFFRLMTYYFFNIITMQILTLPFALALVYNRMSLAHINIPQVITMVLISNFFYAGVSLYISSKIDIMEKIGDVWMRFIYPLWYFGGYHFSWKALYSFSPWLAYFNLLNPMTWLMEGLRGAFLNSFEFLPFWQCALIVLVMGFAISWRGIYRLKKQLDCL